MPLPENIFILFYWTAPDRGGFFIGKVCAKGGACPLYKPKTVRTASLRYALFLFYV